MIGALLGALVLTACGGDVTPAGSLGPDVPVPTGLEQGCPPPGTPLRHPGGDLPAGAVAVRLCPGALTVAADGSTFGAPIQAPADDLTTGVADVVEVVNDLPVHDPDTACHMDDGPHHVYWFRYPDGDARAVAYDEAGCHVLTVGEELAFDGGERVAEAFAGALAAQREAATPPPVTSTGTPACATPPLSEPTTALPHVPPAMTAASWCVGVAPYRVRAALVPARLLRRLDGRLLREPAQGRDDCTSSPYGETIEGITAWGDRVTYLVQGCRVHARTGFGRDHIGVTYAADRELLAELRSLQLGPVQRWPRP